MAAMTIMVQGTTSSAGKSVICAGLCRIFRQDGLRVAPFKSQNMSTKSAIATGGGEISAAQAFQAFAAGIESSVHMNPVLLKPTSNMASEVVMAGKRIGIVEGADYKTRYVEAALEQIEHSLGVLMRDYDVVVIEGAGSPAEVNLRDRDICNMRIARMANAPVILVGNIDPGGVLAAIVGTLELLDPDDVARVAGLVINKFRGDFSLLQPGLDFLERRTGKPVLGVIPYIPGLNVVEEDSLSAGAGTGGSLSRSAVDRKVLDKTCDMLADSIRGSLKMDEIRRIMQTC